MSRCYGKFAAFLQLGSWFTEGILDAFKPLGRVYEATIHEYVVFKVVG